MLTTPISSAQSPSQVVASKKITVFIADDSAALRERLAILLTDVGGVEIVGQAHDVRGAIDSILSLKPEVVILDIRMPGGNGIHVLQSIKRQEPSPIVIMLTNYPYLPYRRKCLESGADYFFDKSTEFNRIQDVFKKLADQSRSGSEHGQSQ